MERLDVKPTPELWCLLGDLTEVPQHYLTAWDLSKRRYARAMRSLGSYCLRQEKVRTPPACFPFRPVTSWADLAEHVAGRREVEGMLRIL